MSQRTRFNSLIGALALELTAAPAAFSADTVEIKMLDEGRNGQARVFRPAVARIEAGDTVHFIPTDFGHDVASVDGLQPEGAKTFSGYKNAPLKVTLEKPGVHIYECEAHRKKGMVGAIIVGDASTNLEKIKKKIAESDQVSDKAEKRLADLLTNVKG